MVVLGSRIVIGRRGGRLGFLTFVLKEACSSAYHAGGYDEVGIVVVDGGVLACGDALDAAVGGDAVAVGGAAEVALVELGGVSYLEFDVDALAAVEAFAPDVFAEEVESGEVDLVAVLCGGVVAL